MKRGSVVLLAVAALVAASCTSAPFTIHGERAVGQVENNLGDTYHLDASQLSATWTFTRDAPVVVSFKSGDVTFDGKSLDTGCYSGQAKDGDVLLFQDAHSVSFDSPDSNQGCQPLPGASS